jgi:hypothetical protein
MNASPTIVVVIVTLALCLPFVRLMGGAPDYHQLPQVHTPR